MSIFCRDVFVYWCSLGKAFLLLLHFFLKKPPFFLLFYCHCAFLCAFKLIGLKYTIKNTLDINMNDTPKQAASCVYYFSVVFT